jgi:acylpyruvate hydrolase
MTLNWEGGMGLARISQPDGPVMVVHLPGSGTGEVATIEGATFADLPELLHAARGDADRIEAGDRVTFTESDVCSPVGRPRKIVCAGANYLLHLAEGGRSAAPPYPDFFPKWDSGLAGPYADIPLPPESTQIDFESELAIVIGRQCRRVTADEVPNVIFGYTIANDVSVRDYQRRGSQVLAGKTWDSMTPVGPVVVPADHVGGATPDLLITGLLNGEVMQHDRTSSMIYSAADLVSYLSTFTTLEPGDLILTGTPSGVGAARNPPLYLTDGDEFRVQIEGLGELRNRYRMETPV